MLHSFYCKYFVSSSITFLSDNVIYAVAQLTWNWEKGAHESRDKVCEIVIINTQFHQQECVQFNKLL
jgi:hypothetical protein